MVLSSKADLKLENLTDLVSVSAEKTADTDSENWPILPIPIDRYIANAQKAKPFRGIQIESGRFQDTIC